MPPRKRVTIVTIAEKLGISPTTVGFVLRGEADKVHLSQETVRRVREAAKEMGYVPNMLARGLRRQRTGVIGLVLPELSMNWAERLHQGITSVLDGRGYTSFIVTHRWQLERQEVELRHLDQLQVDGIVCMPVAGSQSLYRDYVSSGYPFLLVGDKLSGLDNVNVVGWDSEAAALKVVRHLVEQGCRRLACLGPKDENVMSGRRVGAFWKVLEGSPAVTRDEWVVRWGMSMWTDNRIDEWVEQTFGADERPDGVFCVNDAIALSLLASLDQRGVRVPEDVAVAGMGDLVLAGMPRISLTTARAPVYEMGAEVARKMLQMIEDSRENLGTSETWLDTAEIIERRTTDRRSLVVAAN